MGWSWSEWAAESKQERARWMAFFPLLVGVEAYANQATELKKTQVTLDDWLNSDPEEQRRKMQFAASLSMKK